MVGYRNGTEEPDYSAEKLTGAVEIRRYGARLAAETTIAANEEAARNTGFRRLARYIFGANQADEKIAMTAPVVQQSSRSGEKIAMTMPVSQVSAGDSEWVIRFFMPADKSWKIPRPSRTTPTSGLSPCRLRRSRCVASPAFPPSRRRLSNR